MICFIFFALIVVGLILDARKSPEDWSKFLSDMDRTNTW